MNVSEIFGPTFQGEGPTLGMPATFLRLMGCNLHCVWCDTPYTWRFSNTHPHVYDQVHDRAGVFDRKVETTVMTADETIDELLRCGLEKTQRLVVTGGEPMLQQNALQVLLTTLWQRASLGKVHVEIETAGTVYPAIFQDVPGCGPLTYNVSPKLENSRNDRRSRYRGLVLKQFEENEVASFKFVVCNVMEFVEVDEIVAAIRINPRRVYIMPEGVDAETIGGRTQLLADAVLERGYNLTTRLQILAYGNVRGT